MFSLILNIDIDYLIIILSLMALVSLVIFMIKRYSENMNFKTTLVLICLVFVWCFTSYKLFISFIVFFLMKQIAPKKKLFKTIYKL